MRRSFRVATVFTGVAAVAGGFGPTALAAAATRSGSITNVVCGANNGGLSTWVHMYYPNDDHPAECFGNRGTTPAEVTISQLCPGNNRGYLQGSVATFHGVISFHPGQGRHSDPYWDHALSAYFRVSIVHISGWSGDAKCT
jgi:hypothetical protein